MAQTDTGLGWSAKSEWLLSVPGRIGNINSSRVLTNPLPQADSINTVESAGYIGWYNGDGAAVYIATDPGSPPATAFIYFDGNDYRLVIVCDEEQEQSFMIHCANSVIRPSNLGNKAAWARTADPVTGLYYVDTGFAFGYYWPDSAAYAGYGSPGELPVYSSFAEGMTNMIVSTPVYKLTPGYAVACFVRWKYTDGTFWTPFLISTDPDAVRLSPNGTDPFPSEQVNSALYDGLRFYVGFVRGIPGSSLGSAVVPDIDISPAIATLEEIFRGIASSAYANILVLNAPDPWGANTEPSEEDGGEGNEQEDDPVDEETLPIPAVVGLGFSTIYVPTQTDLYNLAAYLWGGNLDLDNFLKLFANPMDSILGLSAVPLVLSGTYEPVYLGGQLLQGITMPRYTGRTAVKVDMGTATIKERWGAYLDYDPYTELAIYVPFVGIKNIKADDVMGKTIRLMYDIDILSGACIAYIRPEGGSPLYEWSGQCAMQIPITGANWDNIFSTAINTVATLGGALFAPASAPVLSGAVASAASQAIAAKPRIERSGAVNGITGFLGQLRPYIIRTIPEAYIPNEQNKFIGYPSYVSVNLGSLSGYNEIASIHLENIPATGDELAELESILKGGVIF